MLISYHIFIFFIVLFFLLFWGVYEVYFVKDTKFFIFVKYFFLVVFWNVVLFTIGYWVVTHVFSFIYNSILKPIIAFIKYIISNL